MEIDKNRYLIDLSQSERTLMDREPFLSQEEPQKVFSAIWKVESMVNGDGFEGLIRCVEPEVIKYAPFALRTIGASNAAAIVDAVVGLMAPHVTETDNWEEVIEELEEQDGWEDQLEALDQKFYAYPDDLTELLFEYVSARPETFGEISAETVGQRTASTDFTPEPSWWKKLFSKR